MTENKLRQVVYVDGYNRTSGTCSNFSIDAGISRTNKYNMGSVVYAEFDKGYAPIQTLEESTSWYYTGNGNIEYPCPNLVNLRDLSFGASGNTSTLLGEMTSVYAGLLTFNLVDYEIVIEQTTPNDNAQLSLSSRLAKYLGFTKELNNENSPPVIYFTAGVATSIYKPGIHRYDMIYLRCPQFHNANNNIICGFFPRNYPIDGTVSHGYQDSLTNVFSVIPNLQGDLQFVLCDATGNAITLNSDLRLSLCLWNEPCEN